MEGSPRTGGWSYSEVLFAAPGRTIVRDPIGILVIPILMQAPLLAFSAIQGAHWEAILADAHPETIWEDLWSLGADPATLWWTLAWIAAAVVLTCVASSFLFLRAARGLRGAHTSLEADFRHAVRRAPAYFVVVVLLFLAFSTGLLVFLLPGLIVLYFWSFAPIVAVTDDCGVFASFAESRRRVRGMLGRWLGSAALLVLLAVALSVVLGIASLLLAGVLAGGNLATGSLVTKLASSVVGVFFTASWISFAHALARTPRSAAPSPASSEMGEAAETRSAAASLFE